MCSKVLDYRNMEEETFPSLQSDYFYFLLRYWTIFLWPAGRKLKLSNPIDFNAGRLESWEFQKYRNSLSELQIPVWPGQKQEEWQGIIKLPGKVLCLGTEERGRESATVSEYSLASGDASLTDWGSPFYSKHPGNWWESSSSTLHCYKGLTHCRQDVESATAIPHLCHTNPAFMPYLYQAFTAPEPHPPLHLCQYYAETILHAG